MSIGITLNIRVTLTQRTKTIKSATLLKLPAKFLHQSIGSSTIVRMATDCK